MGTGADLVEALNKLKAVQPHLPLMSGEHYTGWFDEWGTSRNEIADLKHLIKGLTYLLEHDVSFNLYMANGGTSFGFNSGANSPPFQAQLTSYDYSAPISEAGHPTKKFYAVRNLISEHLEDGEELPDVSPAPPVISIPAFELTEMAPLLEDLPEAKETVHPRPMEFYDQSHGCTLYRTTLEAGGGERLVIRQLHDYGLIYLDGKQIATLDRSLNQNSVVLPERKEEARLDILVEAMGRVNFGTHIHDCKGITEQVQLVANRSIRQVTGWKIFNFPMDKEHLGRLNFRAGRTDAPAFYRGQFEVEEIGDTFLDMRTWGKGLVWVNGHNLGRFWNLGSHSVETARSCPKGDGKSCMRTARRLWRRTDR